MGTLALRKLTAEAYESFLCEAPVAVVHFDAHWDAGYLLNVRRQMQRLAAELEPAVSCAEVDIDEQPQLARQLQLLNIPAIAYYRDGIVVAVLIGADQDIVARTKRVLEGKPIGYSDGLNSVSR